MNKLVLIFLSILTSVRVCANTYTVGSWQLEVTTVNGQANLSKNGIPVLKNNSGVMKIDGDDYALINQTSCTIKESTLSDQFGHGKEIAIAYSLEVGGKEVNITHSYNLYENLDYILTHIHLQSSVEIHSNYLAPVHISESYNPLPKGDNRILFVPFDNDEWVKYNSYSFGDELTSNEVGVLYNATTMDGLVLGSVEHTDWKTGIFYKTNSNGSVTELTAYAGHTNNWTRDLLSHGCVKGTIINSPPILVGWFDDWRTGMETYGDANAIMAPKRTWKDGKPFIWNSWGVIKDALTYMKAAQSALFVADSLVTRGYQNDSTVYMDLDSYWDNITSTQLKQFSKYCNGVGLKSGIYWTPFVDWSSNADRTVEGSSYKYSDIWLYANGQPIKRNGATACDPTHPGTQARAEQFMRNFHTWGYAFIKLDFMVHGIMEADKWYDSSITTGVQAYNYGMRYIDSLAADMYINLSISPLFPANYANGRRIACDAYSSTDYSKYTLNSTTYGWWLDHVYCYNDADHVVFKGQSIGVNRIRLLSSLITGIPCLGDDFSESGDITAKDRAKELLNNPELMQMTRQTRAFRPLDAASGTNASTQYYTRVADTVYVALFNFSNDRSNVSINLSDVGLKQGVKYSARELMRDHMYEYTNTIDLAMPRTDCYVFKIYPYEDHSSIKDATSATDTMNKYIYNNQLYILRNGKTYNAMGTKIY